MEPSDQTILSDAGSAQDTPQSTRSTNFGLTKIDLQSYFDKDPLLRVLFDRMEECQRELAAVNDSIAKLSIGGDDNNDQDV